MLALAVLLSVPLLGGIVLGLVGHRDGARDVNAAFSGGTFAPPARSPPKSSPTARCCCGSAISTSTR
jgi:hypothetical protein